MARLSKVAREGLTVGLLGAAGVIAWFLVVDLIAGQPLRTPGILGQAFMNLLADKHVHSTLFYAAAYTPVHIGAFIVVGMVVSWLVEASHEVPNLTAGFLLLFVMFETGVLFILLLLSGFDSLGGIAWYQIGAANLVAVALIGSYLWRKHPELNTEFLMTLNERI